MINTSNTICDTTLTSSLTDTPTLTFTINPTICSYTEKSYIYFIMTPTLTTYY